MQISVISKNRPLFFASENVFAHPGLFEPLWVTELQALNPVVDGRIAEIGRWLHNRNAEPRLDWLLGHSRSYWRRDDDRPKKEQRLNTKRIAQAYADFLEVEQSPFAQWLPLSPQRVNRKLPNGGTIAATAAGV